MKRGFFLLPTVALAALGCGGSTNGSDFGAGTKCAIVVNPSADPAINHTTIQTALGTMAAGSTVCLSSGTWPLNSQLDVTTGIELRGAANADTILDFKGQSGGAEGISANGADGFKITALTVKNAPGDAIRATLTKGVTFTSVKVTWDNGRSTGNGRYGLYPVQSSNVLIDKCTVSYASDAGIYVGQSSNILVRNSEAFGNVAGIEIENSTGAEVTGCNAHDNSGGILVFSLPSLNVEGSAAAKVHDNNIHDNNGMNFADKAGIVSMVPSGTGVLVMSSKGNEIANNQVTNNDSAGIALVSYLILQLKYTDAKYDPLPTGNSVHDNQMSSNGMNPGGLAFKILLGVMMATKKPIAVVPDLVWDGIADPKAQMDPKQVNCFHGNTDGAQPASFMTLGIDDQGTFHPATDPKPFDCTHDPLPAISL